MIKKYKYIIFLILIFLFSLFLRIFKLPETMPFIPDMGPFFLLAKDMITEGKIPLVSIETSHPWIHHGAHFVYYISLIFRMFDFSIMAAGYFIATLSSISVLILYFTVKENFGNRIAVLSTLFYSTSPLMVLNARMPYHTSLLPFFTILLFFFTNRWVKGSAWSFPMITFLLGVLYNHEITSFVYFIAISIIFFYGLIMRKEWLRKIKNFKIISVSIIAFVLPMLPFLIYDIKTGEYNQTLKFIVWVGYRIVKFPLSLVNSDFKSETSGALSMPQLFEIYKSLIFPMSTLISLIALLLTIIFIIYTLNKHIGFNKKKIFKIKKLLPMSYSILILFILIPLAGLSMHRVPIDADILLFSPFIIIVTVLSVNWIFKKREKLVFLIIISAFLLNAYYLVSTDFTVKTRKSYTSTLNYKEEVADRIVELANGRSYNLIGKGTLSNFSSFTTPYEYLLWKKGNPPKYGNQKMKILVWEKGNETVVSIINEK